MEKMQFEDNSLTDPYLLSQLQEQEQYLEESIELNRKLRKRNRFFRAEVNRLVKSQVTPQSNVLDLGCGDGSMLTDLNVRRGIGIDLDPAIINYPAVDLSGAIYLHHGAIEKFAFGENDEVFDYVILAGVLEHVYDILSVMEKVKELSAEETRILIVTYSRLWQPLFRIAERLGLKAALPTQNWVPVSEVTNLAEQAGLEVIKSQSAILIPFKIPFISRWINKWIAPLPLIRSLNFAHLTVLRPIINGIDRKSVSVVIAARNESGNISKLLDRMPQMSERQEVIFIEGNSVDDTWDVILQECESRRARNYPFEVKAIQQPGLGKGDAVRAGFKIASGDILIILDADLSVPPEELPRFIESIERGNAEFMNGSRLVYGMEGGAMRFLNLLGNRFFGSLFTFLLGQPIRDTLCGTKALTQENYLRIAENRSKFGDFDPFGDFDLLFGAAALNLKIRDQPVHYKARTYGSTNISRFRHGVLLLRMSWIAARKIRFI